MIENTKEEILNRFGIGWHSLIEKIYATQYQFSFSTHISSIDRHNGMLKVLFEKHLTSEEQLFILESIEYRTERLSAKICEGCGKYGIRRTELPIIQTLCTACYAVKYSEINTSVPSWMANQEPLIY